MTVAALEPLVVPSDGTIGTAANFGKPTSDMLKGLIGAAAGQPDANNGNPIFARVFATGLLGFTNAAGITANPGCSPGSIFDTGGAHSVTVPAGQQLVVTQLQVNGSTTASAAVTINDGTRTVTVAQLTSSTTGNVLLGPATPLVLDQNWIITSPQNSGWLGYYVLRDSAVTPIVRSITNAATYTVPNGQTFWLFGAIAANSGQVVQTAGGAQPVCFAPLGNSTVFGNNNGVNSPIPFAPAAVLQGSSASVIGIWGVLI